jgi:hypothetical protein
MRQKSAGEYDNGMMKCRPNYNANWVSNIGKMSLSYIGMSLVAWLWWLWFWWMRGNMAMLASMTGSNCDGLLSNSSVHSPMCTGCCLRHLPDHTLPAFGTIQLQEMAQHPGADVQYCPCEWNQDQNQPWMEVTKYDSISCNIPTTTTVCYKIMNNNVFSPFQSLILSPISVCLNYCLHMPWHWQNEYIY